MNLIYRNLFYWIIRLHFLCNWKTREAITCKLWKRATSLPHDSEWETTRYRRVSVLFLITPEVKRLPGYARNSVAYGSKIRDTLFLKRALVPPFLVVLKKCDNKINKLNASLPCPMWCNHSAFQDGLWAAKVRPRLCGEKLSRLEGSPSYPSYPWPANSPCSWRNWQNPSQPRRSCAKEVTPGTKVPPATRASWPTLCHFLTKRGEPFILETKSWLG